ncbi:MAG: 30S ribosomal protein S9 [bacterium]
MMATSNIIQTTGRRKTSTARVRAVPGTGKMRINNRSAEEFFQGHHRQKNDIFKPLQSVKVLENYDIFIKVKGGGVTGQSGAIKLGIARACKVVSPEAGKILRKEGLLTRDPRMVERKKSGQPKARKRFQFSKR